MKNEVTDIQTQKLKSIGKIVFNLEILMMREKILSGGKRDVNRKKNYDNNDE